jgi:hypothetical protein
MYMSDIATVQGDLKAATDQLILDLSALADKYAAAVGKYPALVNASGSGQAKNTRRRPGVL